MIIKELMTEQLRGVRAVPLDSFTLGENAGAGVTQAIDISGLRPNMKKIVVIARLTGQGGAVVYSGGTHNGIPMVRTHMNLTVGAGAGPEDGEADIGRSDLAPADAAMSVTVTSAPGIQSDVDIAAYGLIGG